MKQPTFSIIMPCYNSEEYVKTALNSIVSQTYPFWELIAVNDGSSDNTLNILESFAKKDERIKIFNKENGGYVSAVNLGLTKISGDYFLFLGSDDQLSTELFETLTVRVEKCEDLPDAIGFRSLQFLDGKCIGNDEFTRFDNFVYEPNCNFKTYIEKHANESAIFTTRDTAKCFKSSKLNGLTYFGKYGIEADGIFSMLFFQNCSSFMSVPFDGYLWTLRSDSVSSSPSLEKSLDRISNWRKFFEHLNSFKTDEISKIACLYILPACLLCVQLCYSFKNTMKYRRFIKDNLQFFIAVSPKYGMDKRLIRKFKFIRLFPSLYSVLYKIKFWTLIDKIYLLCYKSYKFLKKN